jgi:DNA-directed RNA polymerase specialized sigma24 family protein
LVDQDHETRVYGDSDRLFHNLDAETGFVDACETLYSQLSEMDRKIVELRLQDRTLAEIAATIGRSESAVSNRLQRIRSLLQSA